MGVHINILRWCYIGVYKYIYNEVYSPRRQNTITQSKWKKKIPKNKKKIVHSYMYVNC